MLAVLLVGRSFSSAVTEARSPPWLLAGSRAELLIFLLSSSMNGQLMLVRPVRSVILPGWN